MRPIKITNLLKPFRLLFGPSGPGKTGKAKTIFIVAFALLFLYSIIGFLILPPYIKRMAVSTFSDQLGRRVSIESVILNPYTLAVKVKGFEIKEIDGSTTFVSFDSLYVDLQIMTIFKKGPVIREIKLGKPHIHLVRANANAYNFSDIIDRFQAMSETSPPKKPGKPLLFSVSNIQIVDGSIEFDDRPAATKHEITKIHLAIPFVSNLPSYVESFVQPSFSALINGTPLNIRGGSKVFADSHETSVDISLKDINIPYYLAYAPVKLNIKVPSGLLDIVMKATYRQYVDRAPMIVLTGETRIRDLRVAVKGAKDDFLRIPLLSVKDVSFDMEESKIEIGALATEKGLVTVSRSADGRLNFSSLMAAPPQASTSTTKAPPSETTPWIVRLKSFLIDGYTVSATDHSLAEPFGMTVDEINYRAHNISTEAKAQGTFALSMRVEQKGKASADGTFTLNPPSANFKVDVKGIPLKPFQPFLAERAQVILAAGTLNVIGDLKALETTTGEMNASFKGKLWVNNLSLLDKRNAEDLLKWDSLYLGEMDIRNEPLFAHIREISLSNFYSRVLINADRTINIQEVFTATEAAGPPSTQKTEAAAEVPQKQSQPPTIKIDKITLQGGTVNFTDNSIKPRFSANLLEIGGRVSGLSSDENTMGEIELRGMYDRYAPLEITGKVNPLRNDLYVELRADFKDMDLTSVSPYSGRYAGYTVEKGKLSFHLDYLVIKNKLDAKNSVLLDQFTFGDPVESPEATKLPVRFAVALLKDRNGQINLDIPVSGDLNDPKFSVGRVVLKIIGNLLAKIATSPFALLSAIFGSSEQLDHAEFDYGSAAMNDATKKKLDVLEKALHERPALQLDIVGRADPGKDREGLKQTLILRKVRSQKIKEMAKKSGETADLESITVTPEEYPKYLKLAYKEEKFPKPRNVLGMAKDLPVPEMEKLMLTNQKVTEEDVRALAGERALAVRDYLLQSGLVEHERVFIVEAKTLEGKKKEGVKESRVDFTLK